MNRNIASALAMGTATAAAAIAAAAITCGTAFAESPTIETTPFVSSLSRDEVNAELKVPYPGGNPWAGRYDMFPRTSTTTTSEQAQSAYKMSRDEANALNSEDGGSAYFLKSATRSGANPSATMGGPAR